MPVRRIALITNGYPDIYARERSFILPELKALLAYGHQVTLVPVREVTEVDPDLPDGVAVERRLAHLYRPWQLPATVLWMMFRGYFWREAWQCLGRGRLRYLGHFFKESVRATNTLRMLDRSLQMCSPRQAAELLGQIVREYASVTYA